MLQPFANLQKLGQENMEAALKAAGAFSSNAQAIVNETAEFARKSFEHNSDALEKLAGAQSLEKAVEVQSAYVKGAYESFIGQSGKLGALYTALATDTFKPFEGLLSKAMKA
ncbi:phasin family protein [Microvirga makkahensis]|uniref:Phasin family protein n=1 Tax=Microvirga makkahensis TaxID=1128670 RepID=A0A7X3MQ43_9HYPH|nr:phasin family protein [Microvirga makkahensis]MXQ11100.1 phasin family protein [Microvirga makkahensis]